MPGPVGGKVRYTLRMAIGEKSHFLIGNEVLSCIAIDGSVWFLRLRAEPFI